MSPLDSFTYCHKAAPALAVLALVMLSSGAARAQPTADQVVDNETLQAFVEGAKAEVEAITDINAGGELRDRLRTEGPWKSGSMFLIIFLKSGEPFIHGNDREAESKNLIGVEDDNGLKVVEELLAAAARGGDFEEAAKVYREAVLSEGFSALTGIRSAFREEGGDWKSGSIYQAPSTCGSSVAWASSCCTQPSRSVKAREQT